MTPKVRKGLGLLVLVPLLVLADLGLFKLGDWLDGRSGSVSWLSYVATILAAASLVAAVALLIGGLVLVARGLLREDAPTR